jgi:predicted nucleic acid-binding Zn ribbon protein
VSGSTDLPRRLGDIITPALGKLAGNDAARAYSAWSRAVGEPVTRGTRPKAFRRGQLTVECASSVWANELTYLGPQILRRMDEVAPGHPVERFRFVVGRLPTAEPAADGDPDERAGQGDERASSQASEPSAGQESGASATKKMRRDQQPAPDVQDAARAQAEGVDDGRLRAAIEAALRRSSQEPPEAPGRGTPPGSQK